MKKTFLFAIIYLLLTGCRKADLTGNNTSVTGTASPTPAGFIQYTIPKGEHYAIGNDYKTIGTGELKFVVIFDSTAIYQSATRENQYDINKLYGFADNNAGHQQFSARFGWRWSDDALRLFGYVYNDGAVISRELSSVMIGKAVTCSIKVTSAHYIFTVGEAKDSLPRKSTTPLAQGYQLYPYFGGDETAPHDVHIRIKNITSP